MFRTTKPERAPTDWGEYRPSRARPHEQRGQDDDGRPLVSLLLPRFRNRLLRQWAERLNMQPFRLKLDAVGSFAWLHCDGNQTVAEIGDAMVAEFGTKVDPVEERLTKFLCQLSRGGVIELEGMGAAHRASSPARSSSVERVFEETGSTARDEVTA